MRLKRIWELVPQIGKRGTNEWRSAVILDLGSFIRRGVDGEPCVPCRNLKGTNHGKSRGYKTRKEAIVDRETTKPVCDGEVIGP